jgi:hypothetical protein
VAASIHNITTDCTRDEQVERSAAERGPAEPRQFKLG